MDNGASELQPRAGAAQAGTPYREMLAQMDGDDESAILLKRSQRGSR